MNDATLAHPQIDQLIAFGLGKVSPTESAEIERHVAECDACCQKLRTIPGDSLLALVRSADTKTRSPSDANKAEPFPHEVPADLARHPRYRVGDWLGTGGMGTVYRAEHLIMERPVALKVIRRSLVAKPAAVERFRQEVKMAARLVHPNIVTAYDADQAGDTHFLVMELVTGISLDKLVQKQGPLSAAEACHYIRQAALGLQHAGERGMVHRDIKPQNLVRTTEGLIKILDFGLAHLGQANEWTSTLSSGDTPVAETVTVDGEVMGTPDYIAPEQVSSPHTADIRADIYSLGCTFYFLLTGQAPFHEGTALQKLHAHAIQKPTSLTELRRDLPPKLVRMIQRMMAKDRAQRYQMPADVVRALVPFLDPKVARKLPPEDLPWRTQWQFFWRRYKRPIVAAVAVLLVAASILAAPTIIRIANNEGTLVVQTDDPDVEVILMQGGQQVRIVDPKTKRQIDLKSGAYEIKLAEGDNELRLSTNEFTLTRGGREIVKVWRELKVGEIRCYRGHSGGVWDVAFSPDGRRFLSGSSDGTVRLWSVKTGQELRRFDGDSQAVEGVALSPDGRLAIAGALNQTARWWDVETGKEQGSFEEPTGRVRSVAFSRDGQRILACGLSAVRIWDVQSRKEMQHFEGFAADLVHWAAFSPDEHYVLTGDGATRGDESTPGLVGLWDIQTGKRIRRMEGHTKAISCVAFSPDGRCAASASHDQTVRLWDVETGRELHSFVGHQGIVERVAFSPDGRRLLSTSVDKTLRLWDVKNRRELCRFEGHLDSVMGVAFSPDGHFALSGGADGTVRLWRLPEPGGK
jgi:WD40 repeat protein/anti-sigma factor RsiW